MTYETIDSKFAKENVRNMCNINKLSLRAFYDVGKRHTQHHIYYSFVYLNLLVLFYILSFYKKTAILPSSYLHFYHTNCVEKCRELPMLTILERNAAMNRLLKKLAPRATLKLYVAQKISRSNYCRGR